MQAYQAYCENGRIIPIGNPVIPEGRKIIITILDEPAFENRGLEKIKALEDFWSEIENCDSEPSLDEIFDDISSHRFNIDREIDL